MCELPIGLKLGKRKVMATEQTESRLLHAIRIHPPALVIAKLAPYTVRRHAGCGDLAI